MVAHKRRSRSKTSDEIIVEYKCAASTQVGRKCRDGEKPWARSVDESKLDDLVSGFFGEVVSFDQSFHRNVILLIVDSIKENAVSPVSSVSKVREQIQIDELKLNTAFQKMANPPEFIYEQMAELQDRKAALEQEKEDKRSISEVAQQQFEDWAADGGLERKRYLGACWEIAADIVQGTLNHTDDVAFKSRVVELVDDVFLSPGIEAIFLVDEDDQLHGVTFKDADDLLQTLDDMGLEKITCDFEMGIKRGRPKRMVARIGFDFCFMIR